MVYIDQKLWDILWDISIKNYGVYWPKLLDIFGKNYGIYYGIYGSKTMGYIGKSMGYIGQNYII